MTQPLPPDAPNLIDPEGAKVEDRVAERIPWFGPLFERIIVNGNPFIVGFLNNGDRHRAESVVFNQAVSDFIGLCWELGAGNGRSAVRTARSLIEHAVNMADVTSSGARASRYMDHLGFSAEFINDFDLGMDILSRVERRKIEKRRQHAVKKVAKSLADHLKAYGSRFRSSWSEKNLKDRARDFGLDEFYPAYRLCSLFIHGASGAEIGLSKSIGDMRVIRTGPAINLCAFAYITGVRAIQKVVDLATPVEPLLDPAPLADALENMAKAWPIYSRAMEELDKEIWPEAPPLPPMAILAIARNGAQRWYWHSPIAQALIEAEPPELEEKYKLSVEKFKAEVNRNPERFFSRDRRFATITFFDHVQVAPKRGGRIIHETAILLRADEYSNMVPWDQA